MFLLPEFQELHIIGGTLGEFFVLLDDFHRSVVGVHVTLAGGDDGLLVVAERAVALDGSGSLVELVGQDVGEGLVVIAGTGQFRASVIVLAGQDVEGALVDLAVLAGNLGEPVGGFGVLAFTHGEDTITLL